MLYIRLLGDFSADVDGRPIDAWPRKSALFLLQALAIAPDFRATRTQLAEILAEGCGREQLRIVSDALYALKHLSAKGHEIGVTLAEYIATSQDEIWLDKSRCRVDLVEFELAADTALSLDPSFERLSAVVAQCSGPLIPNVAVPLESLVTSVRLTLEQKYLTCARSLVSLHIREDQNERAILTLQSVLRIAPGDEESHRQLIEIFAKLGRHHEAEQQLSLCRIALARDLGIRPSEATINAIRVVRERRLSEVDAERPASSPRTSANAAATESVYAPPKPLVKLIGRDDALAALQTLLTSQERSRLITLCGVGGVGKTQLALEVTSRCASHFRSGAAFVDLTRVTDEPGVARVIAMTLGLKREQGRSWQEQLLEHLKDRDLLLVLDNFEHVHRAAPWLASLMEQCPELVALCTSRLPLLVRGEYVFDVAPLSLSKSNDSTSDQCPSYAAQLFLKALSGSRHVNASNELDAIEMLCRQLDGLPLAIEFAAARASVVGIARLLDQFKTNEVSLHNPMQDAPARHASLRQLLVSICVVLDDRARLALGFAAYFEAGFTVQHFALSGLFAANEGDAILARLVESRVVSVDGSLDGATTRTQSTPRFRLLETVRSYARHSDWIDATTHTEIARAYVRAWHLFTQEIRGASYTRSEQDMFDAFEYEFENISGAIRIATKHDARTAREILVSIWRASVRRGHTFDWISWTGSGLVEMENAKAADQINVLAAASEVHREAMHYPMAQRMAEVAVRGANVEGVDAGAAHCALARAYAVQGEVDSSVAHAADALSAALLAKDEFGQLDALMLKSSLDLLLMGRYGEAAQNASIAREICQNRGIVLPLPLVNVLAKSHRFSGDLLGARDLYLSAATRYRADRERRAEAIMSIEQADCELLALQLDQAHETMNRAHSLVEALQLIGMKCCVHQQLGALQVLRSEPDKARIELDLSMQSMLEGSHMEEADLTLIWFVHAHLLSRDIQAAIEAAIQLTSDKVKIRRFIKPFSIETVARVLIAADASQEEITILLNAVASMRLTDGVVATPAEIRLRGLSLSENGKNVRKKHIEAPENIVSHCHNALRALGAFADVRAHRAPRMSVTK